MIVISYRRHNSVSMARPRFIEFRYRTRKYLFIVIAILSAGALLANPPLASRNGRSISGPGLTY